MESSVVEVRGPRHRAAPEVTIVVPTRNEAGNVAELLRRLDEALDTVPAEVIFVDDSDDETADVMVELANQFPLAVEVIHRPANARSGGLSGAVVTGFRAASAPWVVVMDGDLQHPPEVVPRLLDAASQPGVDLVTASRYAGPGSADGLDGRWRSAVSSLCTRLAKLLLRRKLRLVSDPMSGLFAVRLAAVDLDSLRPRGYKILLEVIGRSQLIAAQEVTYRFEARYSGESKASLGQGARFFQQLLVLRSAMTIHWFKRETFVGFGQWMRRLGHLLRILSIPVLLAAAFPDLTTQTGHAFHSPSRSALIVGAVAIGALVVGRTRPALSEPNVHDRQLDLLLAVAFLSGAIYLRVSGRGSFDAASPPTSFELIDAVLFLFGSSFTVLGTRATIRLRWALLAPLLALPIAAKYWLPIDVALILFSLVALWRRHRARIDVTALSRQRSGHVWPRIRLSALVLASLVAVFAVTPSALATSVDHGHVQQHDDGTK